MRSATALTPSVNPGGRAVVLAPVASPATVCVAVGEVDDVEDRRGRRIALIGDDLVAGIIEVEAGQRDDRTGGNRGRRRVGDRAFARPEAAGGQPAVVGEIDAGARLDVTQEDEGERVRGGAVVVNDGDVADGRTVAMTASFRLDQEFQARLNSGLPVLAVAGAGLTEVLVTGIEIR